jgi:RNA polymerase sigma factor (sigma-70 family)
MTRNDAVAEFTAFFVAYRPRLAALVRRYHHGAPDAIHDILQEVWIKGSRAWPPREPKFARSWLGRIAINEAIMHTRRQARRHPAASVALDALVDRGPLPDQRLTDRELHDAIADAETHIPKQVASLRLVRLEGLTYLEAAREQGLAEGTVKSNVFRAVARLRHALAGLKAA